MAETKEMTPLERAAMALCEARGQSLDAVSISFPDQTTEVAIDAAMRDVRAVLQAIREPTEAMVAATRIRDDEYYFATQEFANEFVVEHWQAMIDAALEEG